MELSPSSTRLRAPRSRSPLSRLRRRLLVHRRGLAAAAAGLAVLAELRATTGPPPPTETAWTAARDLPGGATLRASDLRRVRFAAGTVPSGAVRAPDDVDGRVLAAPLHYREVLTDTSVVGPGLLAGYPGLTAVPVRVSDASVVGLLRVGDRVDVVAADPDGQAAPVEVARRAPVLALPQSSAAASPDSTGRLVLLGLPREDASRAASAAVTGLPIVTWSG